MDELLSRFGVADRDMEEPCQKLLDKNNISVEYVNKVNKLIKRSLYCDYLSQHVEFVAMCVRDGMTVAKIAEKIDNLDWR